MTLQQIYDQFEHPSPKYCWLWTRGKSGAGYGVVHYDGRMRSVHIVLYVSVFGPVPEGLELDHLCRNRNCVNPWHLEPVTHQENILRGNTIMARLARQTHCKRGHLLEGDNLYVGKKRWGRNCIACAKITRSALKDARRRTQEKRPPTPGLSHHS